MTDEMKRDIEWLRSLKEGGHCGEGTFERRLRAQHNDRIDRIITAMSAPSSPGDGWVMVPKAIEDRERLLDEVFTVLEGFSCADLSSRAAYAKIVEIASLPAAPSPGGDHG